MILFTMLLILPAALKPDGESASRRGLAFLVQVTTPTARQTSPSGLVVAADLRFLSVDLFIDTKDQPLAVYQLEFSATKDLVKIVGVEGSSHEAFREAPHFDPSALQQERILLAAFNTAAADKLPRGKVRIATIHLQVTGENDPVFQVKSSIIATIDGKPIEAAVTAEIRRTPS